MPSAKSSTCPAVAATATSATRPTPEARAALAARSPAPAHAHASQSVKATRYASSTMRQGYGSELGRRDLGALRERLELQPGDVGIDEREPDERVKPAVRTRDQTL